MKKQTKSTVNAGFVQGAAILGIAGLLVKIIGAVYRIPLANIVGESGMAYYEVATLIIPGCSSYPLRDFRQQFPSLFLNE